MNDVIAESYLAALGAMTGGPRDLAKRAALEGEERDPDADVGLSSLLDYLSGPGADTNNLLRRRLHSAFARWDIASDVGAWGSDTPPRSRARRGVVYRLLDLDDALRNLCDDLFPIEGLDHVVISNTFEPWYTAERRKQHEAYWPRYSDYLAEIPRLGRLCSGESG